MTSGPLSWSFLYPDEKSVWRGVGWKEAGTLAHECLNFSQDAMPLPKLWVKLLRHLSSKILKKEISVILVCI